MKLLNCDLQSIGKTWSGKRIFLFGGGAWLNTIKYTEIMKLKNQFAGVLDNKKRGSVFIEDIELQIVSPDTILGMHNIVIVLCSPIYMLDMYMQLLKMNLSDDVYCYSFPFMIMESKGNYDEVLLRTIKAPSGGGMIPKTIHSFWFSGDEKPDSYKRCVDSWYKILPKYEIIEWNKDNYPTQSHAFLEKAIECEAWAFATDYARLDVLEKYGGIYLDMDVEVFKDFDDLLYNDALLSFTNSTMVDLAVLAAKKDNHIIKELKKIYDTVVIPCERKNFLKYHQPSLIRDVLHRLGVNFNGSLQQINGGIVFPSEFFMPMDHILFRDYTITENTYCVHYDNFGWSFDGDDKRKKKISDNNKLWNMIEKNQL